MQRHISFTIYENREQKVKVVYLFSRLRKGKIETIYQPLFKIYIHNSKKIERNLSVRTYDHLQLSGDQNDIPHSANFVCWFVEAVRYLSFLLSIYILQESPFNGYLGI